MTSTLIEVGVRLPLTKRHAPRAGMAKALAALKASAEKIGKAYFSSETKRLELAELYRDSVVEELIDSEVATARDFVSWALPYLTPESLNSTVGAIRTFIFPAVLKAKPDYRGAIKAYCEKTPKKERADRSFYSSCCKVNIDVKAAVKAGKKPVVERDVH